MPDYRVQLGAKAFECGRKLLGFVPQAKSATHFTRGSHNYPRFIYHMTNRANYEAIVASGGIKPKMVEFMGQGICATDLGNLFKRWDKNTSC